MGTTPFVISRIESGHQRTSTATIRRLAQALDGQAVFGFDFGTPNKPAASVINAQWRALPAGSVITGLRHRPLLPAASTAVAVRP